MGQHVVLERQYQLTTGHMARIFIRFDTSYARQSSAVVEIWDTGTNKWNHLASEPYPNWWQAAHASAHQWRECHKSVEEAYKKPLFELANLLLGYAEEFMSRLPE